MFPYDQKCEIYSFGVVIAEVFSGSLVNGGGKGKGTGVLNMRKAIRKLPPDARAELGGVNPNPWPVACVDRLRELAIGCLEEHEDRIETMETVLTELRSLEREYCQRTAEHLGVAHEYMRLRDEVCFCFFEVSDYTSILYHLDYDLFR